jgi:hypothetical protein
MKTDNIPYDPLTHRYPRTAKRESGLYGIEQYHRPKSSKRWLIFALVMALYGVIYWRFL